MMGFFDNIKKIASDTLDNVSTTIQQNEATKSMLINQVVSINYANVLDVVNKADSINPKHQLIIDTIEAIKIASIEYNNSESPTK